MHEVIAAVLLPFLGTALGAGCALFLNKDFPEPLGRACSGFAAGVMTAASVWSLLLPALEQAQRGGPYAALIAAGGILAGAAGMTVTEETADRLTRRRNKSAISGTAFLILAVTLHNIPEGLAVGVACAGLRDNANAAGVTALSLGIALQNIPEGAVISLPLRASGKGKARSCGAGIASGAVEPAAALLALIAAAPIVRLMPFLLSCAAGAMIHVTVRELVPEAAAGRSRAGCFAFSAGFVLMMVLDVLL